MADKNSYPQIPTTVWWGLRAALNKTPRATLDDKFVAVHLNVQPAAAKAYVGELKRVGLLNDEFKATELANRWRLDESYILAAKELIEKNYPQGLRDLAEPDASERQKIVRWFQQNGLGEGASKNKAATYILIGSKTVGDFANSGNSEKNRQEKLPPASTKIKDSDKKIVKNSDNNDKKFNYEKFPLNINIQIHISSDAGSEQIESIFFDMKKYLSSNENI